MSSQTSQAHYCELDLLHTDNLFLFLLWTGLTVIPLMFSNYLVGTATPLTLLLLRTDGYICLTKFMLSS